MCVPKFESGSCFMTMVPLGILSDHHHYSYVPSFTRLVPGPENGGLHGRCKSEWRNKCVWLLRPQNFSRFLRTKTATAFSSQLQQLLLFLRSLLFISRNIVANVYAYKIELRIVHADECRETTDNTPIGNVFVYNKRITQSRSFCEDKANFPFYAFFGRYSPPNVARSGPGDEMATVTPLPGGGFEDIVLCW